MKPIIFSGGEVKALLNTKPGVWPAEPTDSGKPCKSVTRRVMKPQPEPERGGESGVEDRAPYKPGDILWVRETWCKHEYGFDYKVIENGQIFPAFDDDRIKWKPSTRMPREAARLFLEVKSVRAERLRDITETDAKAEGVGKTFLKQWVMENEQFVGDAYWIYWDDHKRYWCDKHIDQAVKTFKKEVGKGTAYTLYLEYLMKNPEEIGYMCDCLEEEFPVSCETCGKPLGFQYPEFPDDLDELEGRLTKYEIAHYGSLLHNYEKRLFNKNNIHRLLFSGLWNNINKARGHSWGSNPRVWVYEFMRAEG